MNFTDLERSILTKLDKGMIDGVVGSDYRSKKNKDVIYRNIIENGAPKAIQLKPKDDFFDGRDFDAAYGKIDHARRTGLGSPAFN